MKVIQYRSGNKWLNASPMEALFLGIRGEELEVIESHDLTELEFNQLIEHFRRLMDG